MSDKMDSSNVEAWDGRFSNIIISDSTYPELYAQLSGIPSRLRAERLRVLATIGLSIVQGGFSPMPVSNLSESTPGDIADGKNDVNEGNNKLRQAKTDLKERLRLSVQS